MSLDLSLDTRIARLQALADRLDAGAGPGKLRLYTAPQPDPGAPATGTLLAEIILAAPCGSVAEVDGSPRLTLTLPPAAMALWDGDVAWGRLVDGDNAWVGDGDAGALDSAAFIRLANAHVYGGGLVGLAAAVITE